MIHNIVVTLTGLENMGYCLPEKDTLLSWREQLRLQSGNGSANSFLKHFTIRIWYTMFIICIVGNYKALVPLIPLVSLVPLVPLVPITEL